MPMRGKEAEGPLLKAILQLESSGMRGGTLDGKEDVVSATQEFCLHTPEAVGNKQWHFSLL